MQRKQGFTEHMNANICILSAERLLRLLHYFCPALKSQGGCPSHRINDLYIFIYEENPERRAISYTESSEDERRFFAKSILFIIKKLCIVIPCTDLKISIM